VRALPEGDPSPGEQGNGPMLAPDGPSAPFDSTLVRGQRLACDLDWPACASDLIQCRYMECR
jgi:hypothetical protein